MAKIQIKSETRHELSFFPNSFDDYVPKDSKVRMVDRIVRSMDINPLMDTYDGIGAPPYSPMMLLSLVIFSYINGVYSCRGIADVLKYDVRYMWICGGKQLSFMPSCPVGEALTTSSWFIQYHGRLPPS